MADPAEQPAVRPKNPLIEEVYLIDTTCQPPETNAQGQEIGGFREHIMPINGANKPFRFFHDRPTPMLYAVALKFLRHDAFKLTDETGEILPWSATPRQPHELREGERLELQDNEIIARLDELTVQAIRMRVCQMEGGEEVVSKGKQELIDWMVDQRRKAEKRNVSSDLRADEFVPEPEFDEDLEGMAA